MKLSEIKTIHFTGIKGVAMTALACCAQDAGMKVSGSDTAEVFVTDATLRKRKIQWQVGFSADHLPKKLDCLVYTGALDPQANPEIKTAAERKIPSYHHAAALKLFMEGKTVVSVAGVGGKSTTTAMTALGLEAAGLSPSYLVGVGEIFPLGAPGRFRKTGPLFVSEADEYIACKYNDPTPRFFYQDPKVVVLTNISFDHPDFYRDLNHTFKVFAEFVQRLGEDGLLIACQDNQNIQRFLKRVKVPVQTYGFSPQADWQISEWRSEAGRQVFKISYNQIVIDEVVLQVPGRFNALNATASLAVANFLGADLKKVVQGLAWFEGTKRRFEKIAQINGFLLYDDYAHHPTEIQATLRAAKSWFGGRPIVAIFQPHTYSRTAALLEEFSRSFEAADQVILTPVYASAREKKPAGWEEKTLFQQTQQHHPAVWWAEDAKAAAEVLRRILKPESVILTLGAGDVFRWHPQIKEALKGFSG